MVITATSIGPPHTCADAENFRVLIVLYIELYTKSTASPNRDGRMINPISGKDLIQLLRSAGPFSGGNNGRWNPGVEPPVETLNHIRNAPKPIFSKLELVRRGDGCQRAKSQLIRERGEIVPDMACYAKTNRQRGIQRGEDPFLFLVSGIRHSGVSWIVWSFLV